MMMTLIDSDILSAHLIVRPRQISFAMFESSCFHSVWARGLGNTAREGVQITHH